MIEILLIFAPVLAVMAWLFPPVGGWRKYWRECPLWHDPKADRSTKNV